MVLHVFLNCSIIPIRVCLKCINVIGYIYILGDYSPVIVVAWLVIRIRYIFFGFILVPGECQVLGLPHHLLESCFGEMSDGCYVEHGLSKEGWFVFEELIQSDGGSDGVGGDVVLVSGGDSFFVIFHAIFPSFS